MRGWLFFASETKRRDSLLREGEVLLVVFLRLCLGFLGLFLKLFLKFFWGILLDVLLLICLWLLKRGCRRRRRLGRKVVRKRKSEICPVKKIRRAGECGQVKPE